MTDRRQFVAVVRVGKLYMRKFVPHDNGSWSTYVWAIGDGWQWHDNVSDETACDWRESADEVYFEEKQP